MSPTARIAITLFLPTCVAMASGAIVFLFLSDLRYAEAQVNEVGRKRMVAQQMGAIAHNIINHGHSIDRGRLRKSIEDFDRAIEMLRQGGGIGAIPSAVEPHLDNLESDWRALRPELDRLATMEPDSLSGNRESSEAMQRQLEESVVSLVASADQLAGNIEAHYTGRKDVLIVLLAAFAMIYAALVIFGIFVVRRTIAERSRSTDDQRLLNERLEQANKKLEEFASAAAHDLQAPLRQIGMRLDLFRLNPDRHNDTLDRIEESANRMQRMIADLLSYAQHTTTQDGDEVNSDEALTEAIDALEEPIRNRDAQVHVHPLPTIRFRRRLLVQIFQNLIENGIRYCTKRQPVICITAQSMDDGWEFVVSDNGDGIDPEDQDRIFEPFQRGRQIDHDGGTGMGLAICRKAIMARGGHIRVESTADVGTSFRFYVPHRLPADTDAREPRMAW